MISHGHARPMHAQHNAASPSSSSSSRTVPPLASPKSPIRPLPTHVQAVHDFDPTRVASAAASNPMMYLRFKAGDIIRVHTRDERGWWDGEVSTADDKRQGPRRGWFPSNYVREMGMESVPHRRTESTTTTASTSTSTPASQRPSHSRNQSSISQQSQSSVASTPTSIGPLPAQYQAIMVPVIQALTLLESAIEAGRITHLQPSTACVISAIRTSLEQADCLSKESPTLTKWPQLAKERKLVLVELSRVVAAARTCSALTLDQQDQRAMDALAKAARGVFSSFQKFLSTASEYGAELKAAPEQLQDWSVGGVGPRSPPIANTRIQDTFKMRAVSIGDLRGAKKRESTMPNTAGFGSMRSARDSLRSPLDLTTPMSATFSSSSSGHSSPVSVKSLHRPQDGFDANTSMTSLPFDESGTLTPSSSRRSSQEFLQTTVDRSEERLFSLIAAMVGHIHVHEQNSHPSSHAHLIEMTRDTVSSIRELLTCVEEIGRDRRVQAIRSAELEDLILAKVELYEVASEIVDATEAVALDSFGSGKNEVDYNKDKRRLLVATTSTLRIASECLRALRGCMPDAIGPSVQGTPRPGEAGLTLRPHPVGARGMHTLSALHRKASSLSILQKRYEEDHIGAPLEEEDEDEEIVADATRDEDLTMRPLALMLPPRPPFQQTRSSPMLNTPMPPGRSRSSSLTSPAPPRIQHRSPSRSADLDKFTGDYPAPAPRATLSRPVSAYSMTTPDMARSSASSQQTATSTPQTPPEQGSPILGYLKDEQPTTGIPTFHIDGETTPVKRPTNSRSMTAPTPNGDIRFWVVAHDYDPREIAFNPDGAMIGASLSVLVEKMTPHDGPVDPTFSSTFWVTFRLFTTPAKLLDEVIRRYDLQPPPTVAFGERERAIWIERKVVPVRLRIYNFLKSWLDNHWLASTDDILLRTLEHFIVNIMSRTLPAMAPRLLEIVRQKSDPPLSATSMRSKRSSMTDRLYLSTNGLPPAPSSLPPTPVISKSLHSMLQKTAMPNISIIDFDTTELARQLTIMESKLFCAVLPEDLLQTGRRSIPELKALSTLSNQITGWVADSILNEQDSKKRAGLVKYYIKLADKCFAINNFSTMFAVLAGLNSSTIMRLKKTWDALNSKYAAILEKLRGVIEHTKNHAAYRAKLREVTGPCLPFLGLILTDITFTFDGNPDTRPSTLAPDMTLINQDKYTKLGKIALDFERYQTPFNFHELEAVQAFLRRVLADRGSTSLDALYRKSLLLEPRTGTEKPSISIEKPGWLGGRI